MSMGMRKKVFSMADLQVHRTRCVVGVRSAAAPQRLSPTDHRCLSVPLLYTNAPTLLPACAAPLVLSCSTACWPPAQSSALIAPLTCFAGSVQLGFSAALSWCRQSAVSDSSPLDSPVSTAPPQGMGVRVVHNAGMGRTGHGIPVRLQRRVARREAKTANERARAKDREKESGVRTQPRAKHAILYAGCRGQHWSGQ